MGSVAVATRDVWFRRQLSGRALGIAAALSVAALVIGRLAGVADSAALQTFTLLFVAISVEALPFVLLGAFVAALVEVYASDAVFTRFGNMRGSLQLPVAALAGLAFPVCECGSVPVARRFMRRGVSPMAALAFMLAAPVINPIVLVSTWVAYSPRGLGMEMVLGRAGLGLVLAVAAGWALGNEGTKELLRRRIEETPADASTGAHAHEHHAPQQTRGQRFVTHLTGDFFFMGKFLIVGAGLAAAFQTVLPRSIISGIAGSILISTLALMAVAFVSSLCSEADAFVAVSFSPFPLGAQLGFLVFGPILDFKLAFLYGATFRKHFVARLTLVSIPVVLAGSLWFEAVVGL